MPISEQFRPRYDRHLQRLSRAHPRSARRPEQDLPNAFPYAPIVEMSEVLCGDVEIIQPLRRPRPVVRKQPRKRSRELSDSGPRVSANVKMDYVRT